MKRIAVILLTVLIVLGLSGGSFAQVAGEAELEQQMLDLVNKERSDMGLSPLKMDNELVQLARLKSQDMIDKNYFSHTSPTYGDPFQMMKDFGVEYWMAGENLAGNSSLTGAHEALMDSPGHRANILKPEFTHVGIGVVKGGRYGMMITQMFIKSRNGETTSDKGNTQYIQGTTPKVPVEVNKKSISSPKEESQLSIFYNNKEIKFPDVAPFINPKQRIMVPLRFISQEMGYDVNWEAGEQKITINNSETIMNLWIGKNSVLRNNKLYLGDSSPEVHNDRTMIPLRMVSQLLGCKVTWYPTLNKAEIN